MTRARVDRAKNSRSVAGNKNPGPFDPGGLLGVIRSFLRGWITAPNPRHRIIGSITY